MTILYSNIRDIAEDIGNYLVHPAPYEYWEDTAKKIKDALGLRCEDIPRGVARELAQTIVVDVLDLGPSTRYEYRGKLESEVDIIVITLWDPLKEQDESDLQLVVWNEPLEEPYGPRWQVRTVKAQDLNATLHSNWPGTKDHDGFRPDGSWGRYDCHTINRNALKRALHDACDSLENRDIIRIIVLLGLQVLANDEDAVIYIDNRRVGTISGSAPGVIRWEIDPE